ncbi:MAG: hypothetical protein ABI769_08525 [Pseudomonadota bacterium]
MLAEIAAAGGAAGLGMIAENRALWIRLGDEAGRELAMFPFVIVDAQFANASWWRRASAPGVRETAPTRTENGLTNNLSVELMHEVSMFAWQMARWDRMAAQMSLGMTSSVADTIAALTPQQLRTIASTMADAIEVRWGNDVSFWCELLDAATSRDMKRLTALQLHAKLRLCSELVQV